MKKAIPTFLKVIHVIFECIRWVIVLIALLLMIMFLSGIRFYIVMTGSMSPTIPVGSICVVNHNTPYSDINAGDVISFSIGENMQVTHRAISIEPDGIVTKGDANNTEDATMVTEENYLGKTVFHIPSAGYVFLFLKSRIGRVIVCVIILLLIGASFLPDKNNSTAH